MEADPIVAETLSESQEDRIAWLRKRGVIIEMPGEAKSDEINVGDTTTIVCVKIPCDENLPLEEITVKVRDCNDGDQLIKELKCYFGSSNSSLNEKLLQEAAAKQFGNEDLPPISKETISKLADQGSVETFCLSQPYLETDCNGVYIYLDEAGQLKGLPFNRRASALAQLCGFENVPFAGDVFVGKVHFDTSTGLKNISIYKHDIDSSAPWIKGVFNRNYQHGIETNKVGIKEEKKDVLNKNEVKGYTWRHVDDETIEVLYNLPNNVVSHKDVLVKFLRNEVMVKSKSQPTNVLLNLYLISEIVPDECTWTVSSTSGNVIDITLTKCSNDKWEGKLEK